jgi:dTDP-4-amino-4,6-dideoxygalactose transaminase
METKGIDVNQVRDAITPKTKAISWVNYAGVAPDIEGLQTLAKEFDLILIEDNAHGLGGSYKGRPLGSYGDFATQSFHATKNIQCGEGGALVINNAKFIERAEIIREKGTDRSKFIRGEVQKYQWVDHGSSYLLAESLAAVLLGQLENFELIQAMRNKIHTSYFEQIKVKHTGNLIDLESRIFTDTNLVAHMFYLTLNEIRLREPLRLFLQKHGIATTSHYVPLEKSRAGLRFGRTAFKCEVSADFSSKILRLPLHNYLSTSDIERIVETLFQIK